MLIALEKRDMVVNEEKSVWTKDEIEQQIRRLENQLDVVQKQHGDKDVATNAKNQLKSALENFSEDKFVTTENGLIDVKGKLISIVNGLSIWRRFAYFVSVWGVVPLSYAIAGLSISLYLLTRSGSITIMGVVPLWALLAAAVGASVQILVGVVKDYKDDCLITDYKRLWYLVVIPVSLAFGFIAFLLIQAGLITVSQGTFIINPTNQTITSMVTTRTSSGASNQATTITAYGLAMPLILCFLAGYATDWFMGLLGKLTSTTESEKK